MVEAKCTSDNGEIVDMSFIMVEESFVSTTSRKGGFESYNTTPNRGALRLRHGAKQQWIKQRPASQTCGQDYKRIDMKIPPRACNSTLPVVASLIEVAGCRFRAEESNFLW